MDQEDLLITWQSEEEALPGTEEGFPFDTDFTSQCHLE